MMINNNITPGYQTPFSGIQRICKLGYFSYGGQALSYKRVEDSFKNSKVLQKYCNENDVHVIMASDTLINCKKRVSYASLDLTKLFPKKELSLLGKFINLFKKQPREAIIIRTYADNAMTAREDLAKCINNIKTESDLESYISYKKYNPVVMEKCRTCGWNIDRQYV